MPRENAPEMIVQPIRPEDVTALQLEQFPPEVVQTFNTLIAENIAGGEAIVSQNDVIENLVLRGLHRAQIYQKGWLNVEDMYRDAGWKVEYDRPGHDESYQAFFRFQAPRK